MVKIFVYAVLIYVVIYRIVERTVAYDPFDIPSAAMMPTLLVGDIFFVSKFSYGYSRYSLPFGLPLFSGRIFFHPPERGDVVVFRSPTDNSTDWIKRLIGLPGDHIQMKNGILYINNQPCPRRRIEDYLYREGSGAIICGIANSSTRDSSTTAGDLYCMVVAPSPSHIHPEASDSVSFRGAAPKTCRAALRPRSARADPPRVAPA